MNTTAQSIVFAIAADLPEGFDFDSVPFENDTWKITAPTGEAFVIASEHDEDGEVDGFTWTEYDGEYAGATDGSDNAKDARDALTDWLRAAATGYAFDRIALGGERVETQAETIAEAIHEFTHFAEGEIALLDPVSTWPALAVARFEVTDEDGTHIWQITAI